MAKKKLRPVGKITSELEPLIQELATKHEMQIHEILGIVYLYLQSHCPDSIEHYIADGSSPVLYYGHKDHIMVIDNGQKVFK